MSAQEVQALHQQAHALDAEADALEAEYDPERDGINSRVLIGRHPGILRIIAKEFHELAERMQGNDPATVNAIDQANQQMSDAASSADSVSVQKEMSDG
jgi:hypothetical protein